MMRKGIVVGVLLAAWLVLLPFLAASVGPKWTVAWLIATAVAILFIGAGLMTRAFLYVVRGPRQRNR